MKNMNHFSIYSILTCPYNNLKIRKIITSLSMFAATVSSIGQGSYLFCSLMYHLCIVHVAHST